MIDTLTSLRFIFALMVFGAHCYVIDDFFDAHFFKEGFVGVSFFFVLSGFILSYNYREKLLERRISRRTFWVARIARIYPLHWLTLFVAAISGNYVVASGGIDWLKHFLASLTLTFPEAITSFPSTARPGACVANNCSTYVFPFSSR